MHDKLSHVRLSLFIQQLARVYSCLARINGSVAYGAIPRQAVLYYHDNFLLAKKFCRE